MGVVYFPQGDLPIFLDVVRCSIESQFLFWVVVNLFLQKTLGLHPLFVHLFRALLHSFPRVHLPISWLFGLSVHMVGAHKLKGVGRLVALRTLLLVVVPNRTFHCLIHGDEAVELVKDYSNDS